MEVNSTPVCPSCGRPVNPKDAVCFHCRAVLDPFTRGSRVSGRYLIEESIGQGGMGRVYRAYDEVLHERVAIKTLLPELARDPSFVARFHEEIRLARRVTHPNVCRIHDYVDHQGTPFLSMEWVEGESLAERIRRLGARPETEIATVHSDVIAALLALWSNGIVHRDLKPANLMWTSAGRVKVMDFGLARALQAKDDRHRTSGVLGSPEYLSPEQIRGEDATTKSDTYALGVTLFELATGRPPFHGDTPAQTLMKHLAEPPDVAALVSLSDTRRVAILRYLEKDAAARPDLRKDEALLTANLGEQAIEKKTPTAWRAAGWLTLMILAIVAVFVSLRPFGTAAPTPSVEPRPSTSPAETFVPGPSPVETPHSSPQTGEPASTPSVARPSPAPSRTIAAIAPTPSIEVIPSPPTPNPSPAIPSTPLPSPSQNPEPSPAAPVIAPTPPSVAIAEPRLLIVVSPWAEVFVDGERKGLTPMPAFVLPRGPHRLELRHPDYRPLLRTVDLKPGETLRLSVDLRTDAVRR